MFSSLAVRSIMRANNKALVMNSLRYFATIRRFTPDHEWIEYNTETKEAKIGITNFAQGELGDIVHLEIAEVGTRFAKGDGICGIESVKTAADVYAPVTGEITAHNENVKSDAAIVNSEAEKDGWVLKVRVEDPKDIEELMDEKAYAKYVEENKH